MSDLARFLAREIRRQTRNSAGNTFGKVEGITEAGRLQVSRRGGLVEVNPAGVVGVGESVNLNRGHGLLQFDGGALYGF